MSTQDLKQRWREEVDDVKQAALRRPQSALKRISRLLSELREAKASLPADPDLPRLEALARFSEALAHGQAGRLSVADASLRELRRDFDEMVEPLLVAQCLSALSVVAERQGDATRALKLMEQTFHMLRRHGASRERLAHVLMNIGIKQAMLEDPHAALETLSLAEEMCGDDHEMLGTIWTNQALIHRSLGDHQQCSIMLDTALELLEPLGPSSHLVNALLERAVEDIRFRSLDQATARLQWAKKLVDKHGLTMMVPECHLVSARLLIEQGAYQAADDEIAVALSTANTEQRLRLLPIRAEAAEAAEDWQGALRWLRASHAEQMAVAGARHRGQLAAVQARLTANIDEEQRRTLRKQLQHAQDEVHALTERLKDQQSLLAVTAHDIKNPLTIVLILGELAASSPEAFLESADGIVEAALHMQSLVSRLITPSSQSEVRPVLTISPIPLQGILEAACTRYQPIALVKEQVLIFRCEPELGPVEGDPSAIERVLDNLLSNAIKYTPSGGRVEVDVRQHGAHIILEVLDTGPGLSPSDLERVFFYHQRLSAVPTHGEPQHGLGLVSVRHLVSAMGGRVYAENRLRGGARFVVELMTSCTAEPQA